MNTKAMEVYFNKKEKIIDKAVELRRKIVRLTGKAIKALHEGKLKESEKYLKEAKKLLKDFPKDWYVYHSYLHVCQELYEGEIVLYAVKKKKIPKAKKPYEAFLTGLLDAIGELKREMYEALRKGKIQEAKAYFSLMEEAYDSLLPLKYSEAVLPEFRRKQDIARIQLEQARGELLRKEESV